MQQPTDATSVRPTDFIQALAYHLALDDALRKEAVLETFAVTGVFLNELSTVQYADGSGWRVR